MKMEKEIDSHWFYRLDPVLQNYAWGNRSNRGAIYRFLKQTRPDLEPDGPLAELWMGDHPSGPSRIVETGETLATAVARDPEHFLGPFSENGKMPYLFKILDASMALSIQTHPDIVTAERLHRTDPEHYPDANHKPELLVSLGHVTALAGFRPVSEIKRFFQIFPELSELCQVDPSRSIAPGEWLQTHFSALMQSEPEAIQTAVQVHMNRVGKLTDPESSLFYLLRDQYGEQDPGVFCVYFLNRIELGKLDSIFLPAGVLHAYIQGDMIECMASSDNVIRAGLTGKYRDVKTLLEIADYSDGTTELFSPAATGGWDAYTPDLSEFAVYHAMIEPGKPLPLPEISGPGILLILDGSLTVTALTSAKDRDSDKFQAGEILFFPGDLNSRKISLTLDGQAQVFFAAPGKNRQPI